MKFYETEEGKGFDHVRAQILGVGQKFIEEMERRVTEAPEEIPMRDLRETATVLLDRAGYAPQQQHQHEVHVHVGLANAVESSRVAAPKLTHEPEGRGHGPAGAREFPSEGAAAYPAQPGAALFPPKAAPD